MTQEELEKTLEHEKAKVRWLCRMLEYTNDGGHHGMETRKTAAQWELCAELSLELERQAQREGGNGNG